jgi:cytochrome c oxidase subunit 3
MWFALAAIMMLFIAFTSAYIIRQGMSDDWRPLQMPPVLWLTTAMLIGSSITLEIARRMMKRDWVQASSRWLSLTAMLGTAFLIGQLLAWRQLRASGIYMNSNPHSSFFYVLTGAHGLHLFGGVIALYYITLRAWRESKLEGHEVTLAYANGRIVRLTSLAVDLTAVYWHFMDGLWIYLFVLLFVW